MLKKLFFMLLCITGTATFSFAQQVEYGLFLGTANYDGDLTEKVGNLENTRPAGGLFFRYNFTSRIGFRTAFTYGTVSAGDAFANDPDRKARNLSFKSNIADGSLLLEITPFGFNDSHKKKIAPYIFAGLGVFHFNPKAQYREKWYALQPLSTEGQGLAQYPTKKPYKLTQVSYPFGGGFKYNPSQSLVIGLEIRFHKTYTDYLDDVSSTYADPNFIRESKGDAAAILSDRSVELPAHEPRKIGSPRGDATDKDWYIFTGITLSYTPRIFGCYNKF